MTNLQLLQSLWVETGQAGTPPTTVIGQTNQINRFIGWLNNAWIDIQSLKTNWDWMRTSTTFPTVTGQLLYTPAQAGVTAFGQWERDSFRNYVNPSITLTIASPCVVNLAAHQLSVNNTIVFATTGVLPTGLVAGTTYYVQSLTDANNFTLSATVGGIAINTTGTQSGTHTITSSNVTTFVGFKSEVFMSYLDYDSWRDAYLFGANRQIETRPLVLTISPAKALGMGPGPVAGYTVVGDYFASPTSMTLDADMPSMPSQYHMLIVYSAMRSFAGFTSAPEVFNRGEMEYNKLMRRLLSHELPEVLAGGSL